MPNIHRAHAGGITFIQATGIQSTCSTTCTTGTFADVSGDTLLVIVWGIGAFNSFSYSDLQGNSISQKVASVTGSGAGTSTYIAGGTVAAGGTDSITVSTGGPTRVYSIVGLEYRNVNGFGITATSQNDNVETGASTVFQTSLTFQNTAGLGGAIIETDMMNNIVPATGITYNNGQTQRVGGTGTGVATVAEGDDYVIPGVSFTTFTTFSFGSASCNAVGNCFNSESGLELTGAPGQVITSVTNCYGNCGTPPVKLANTNSTHSVNWNSSITLFYEFQVSVTGILLNVTTSLAKTYNNLDSPELALYTSNCALGQIPFSTQCPGSQFLGGTTGSGAKGKQAIPGGSQYALTAASNVWYAVALSFPFAPTDVNDTNTNVQLFQTSGQIPPVITSSSVFSSTSKIGIWAWVAGNVIGQLPPPSIVSGCSSVAFATLDCLITNLVNSFCSNLTVACQTGSSLFWAFIFTLVSMFLMMYGEARILHTRGFSQLMGGQMFISLFLIFVFIEAGIGLVSSFVVVFFTILLLLPFSKNAGKFF